MSTLRAVPPLLIISPMFPPMSGGLPDHTELLAEALRADFEITVLTSPGADTERPYRVCSEVSQWQRPDHILAAIQRVAPAGAVLWQYVPHMYGRGGANPGLPLVLRRLRSSGRRQVVIVHEIAAPFSVWPHRFFYAMTHRWMWRGVRRWADALGISTGAWLERLRTRRTARRLFLAASPSNVPVVSVVPGHGEEWRSTLGLDPSLKVLAFFGSVGAGKQFDWVIDAWRHARSVDVGVGKTGLVVIGAEPEPALTAEEQKEFRALGHCDRAAVSRALQAVDLLLLPFADGVSERRSTFMAGLSHGVPVLTTTGPATSHELLDSGSFMGVSGGEGAFRQMAPHLLGDAAVRRTLSERGRARYQERYDWPRLAATLRDRLSRSAG